MTDIEQLSLIPPPEMAERIRDMVERMVAGHRQPSALELLEQLEKALGWAVRWDLEAILQAMSSDRNLPGALRGYIVALLGSEEWPQALRGEGAPERELVSSIDTLVQQSRTYRNSGAFSEMVSFMTQFREYAPFNNMLVRIQNPSCQFYATERDWKFRFGRDLIEDARPMLILAPMHPVMLVYDLDQTQGGQLPQELLKFSRFEGHYTPQWMERMLDNAAGHRIKVAFKTLSSSHSGFATLDRGSGSWKMRIAIHDQLDAPSQFGVLCHEIAHILLGHLGTDKDLWWPCRRNLTRQTAEIEAEAAAYIIMSRLGLQGSSPAYISRYLGEGELPPSVSIDLIAKVAGHLEKMALEKMPARRPRKEQSPKKK